MTIKDYIVGLTNQPLTEGPPSDATGISSSFVGAAGGREGVTILWFT